MTTTGASGRGIEIADQQRETAPPVTGRVVVTSPGSVDMTAIEALANGLGQPVALLAKAIYHAPSILATGLTADQQSRFVDVCDRLGLETEGQPDGESFEADPKRFDIAVQVVDGSAIAHAVEVVARFVGVTPEHAYLMLATPPGSIIGDVSEAAARALIDRFGPGVDVVVAPAGRGPFDLFVSTDAPPSREIYRLCGDRRGLVPVDLDHQAAKDAFARLPQGSVRPIDRNLVRYDLVFEGRTPDAEADGGELSADAVSWLMSTFALEAAHIPVLVDHAPIALAERLDHEQAMAHADRGQQLGLALTTPASGFGRYAVEVVDTFDRRALIEALDASGLPAPVQLPAVVATDLSDLDARWIGFQLEAAGATISFLEITDHTTEGAQQ